MAFEAIAVLPLVAERREGGFVPSGIRTQREYSFHVGFERRDSPRLTYLPARPGSYVRM
jgi:hypothetical protein